MPSCSPLIRRRSASPRGTRRARTPRRRRDESPPEDVVSVSSSHERLVQRPHAAARSHVLPAATYDTDVSLDPRGSVEDARQMPSAGCSSAIARSRQPPSRGPVRDRSARYHPAEHVAARGPGGSRTGRARRHDGEGERQPQDPDGPGQNPVPSVASSPLAAPWPPRTPTSAPGGGLERVLPEDDRGGATRDEVVAAGAPQRSFSARAARASSSRRTGVVTGASRRLGSSRASLAVRRSASPKASRVAFDSVSVGSTISDSSTTREVHRRRVETPDRRFATSMALIPSRLGDVSRWPRTRASAASPDARARTPPPRGEGEVVRVPRCQLAHLPQPVGTVREHVGVGADQDRRSRGTRASDRSTLPHGVERESYLRSSGRSVRAGRRPAPPSPPLVRSRATSPCGVANVLWVLMWTMSKPMSPGRHRPRIAFRFAPS